MTETVEGHHRFNGHEFGQAPGDGEGQGSLVCCSPWGHKESDMTWQLNNNHSGILYSSEMELVTCVNTSLKIRFLSKKNKLQNTSTVWASQVVLVVKN